MYAITQEKKSNMDELVAIVHEILMIAEDDRIEGLAERMKQAERNYRIAYWKDHDDSSRLMRNALLYAINTGSVYMQEKIIERTEGR